MGSAGSIPLARPQEEGMQILRIPRVKKGKRKRPLLRAKTQKGKTVSVYVKKNVPKGCSVPWQICLTCRTARIRKGSKYYDAKKCSECWAKEEV